MGLRKRRMNGLRLRLDCTRRLASPHKAKHMLGVLSHMSTHSIDTQENKQNGFMKEGD